MSFLHQKHNKFFASAAMSLAMIISMTGFALAQYTFPPSSSQSSTVYSSPASPTPVGTQTYSAQGSPLYNPATDPTSYIPGSTPASPYVPTRAAATIPDSVYTNAPVNSDFSSNNSSSNSSSNCGSNSSGSVTTLCNPLQGVNSISDLVLKFMVIVSYLAVIFGVLMLIWIGLQFVMAQGKPEEIKKHREQLLWVIVGIGVVLGAKVLVTMVINTLQATGTVNSTVLNNTSNALKQL